MSDETPTERKVRKWTRTYAYGYTRANDWPLWVSWLLAPTPNARLTCRTLMQIKRGGRR